MDDQLVAYIRRLWQTAWHSATPRRAASETLVVAGVVASIALALTWRAASSGNTFFLRDNVSFVLLAGPVVALYCAARMRPHAGHWWQSIPSDLGMGVVLGIIPASIMLASDQVLIAQGDRVGRVARAFDQRVPAWTVLLIALAAFGVEFVLLRLGVRGWLFWDQLRRRHLRWALTHALLSVAVMAATSIALLAVTLTVATRGATTSLAVVPILFFLAVLTLIGLAIVLPPSALFSYLFVRHTTQRLQTLARATGRLRAGDYAIRVPVAGEDEVAELQANFNAMAADLERAVGEVQAERDTVAGLLRARRELVASVSHELRTPVAMLRGYLESTLTHWNGEPPATLRRDLEVMERETVRLQTLINDLFTLARTEVGQLDLRLAPSDVGEAARRVADTTAPLAWQSGRVEVVAQVAPGLPRALADEGRLEQVLLNLVHNAVRHTPPGGIVAIHALPEGDAVLLRVRDTGSGIAPEDLPHVWERFYRGENARASASGGSGLGLALVKELTEAMGGVVSAESMPGEGSTFTVRLPRARGGRPAATSQPTDAAPKPSAPTPHPARSPS
jgi:signal transduction histidine kinase